MLDHLDALKRRLANERQRLENVTKPQEIALRNVYIAQCEREINSELAFLAKRGIQTYDNFADMTDDQLLEELLK